MLACSRSCSAVSAKIPAICSNPSVRATLLYMVYRLRAMDSPTKAAPRLRNVCFNAHLHAQIVLLLSPLYPISTDAQGGIFTVPVGFNRLAKSGDDTVSGHVNVDHGRDLGECRHGLHRSPQWIEGTRTRRGTNVANREQVPGGCTL